jgi:hypothetical protein
MFFALAAVQHLRTLLSLILTNSEVRKLFSDLSLIGRDLLARAASKAAEKVRPDPEALAHVDDSAPQDQFVTENGRTTGLHETPVPEARIPGTSTKVSQHPKDDLGTDAKVTNGEGQVITGEQAYRDGANQAQQIVDQGTNDVQNGSADSDGKKQGLIDKVRGLRVRGFSLNISHF